MNGVNAPDVTEDKSNSSHTGKLPWILTLPYQLVSIHV